MKSIKPWEKNLKNTLEDGKTAHAHGLADTMSLPGFLLGKLRVLSPLL
jgi:hypothetical protein